ncbi:hypothetical protein TPENAI_60784 [Tenacibaculum litopenaei]|uniref:hypothetical protein n=1 Tax=Tenacibaculum litopenaei TaxID=396016 RepID=UPI0038961F4A
MLDELYNDNQKIGLKKFLEKYIIHFGEQQNENVYLLNNIYDDDGLEDKEKSFLVDLRNDFKIIDVCVQKKIFDDFINVIIDVTYGNVFQSTQTPFILDSCFFRLFFDLSNEKVIDKEPYNIETYYTSAFSDDLNESV